VTSKRNANCSCRCRSNQVAVRKIGSGALRLEIGGNVLDALCAFGSLHLYRHNVTESDDVWAALEAQEYLTGRLRDARCQKILTYE